MSEFICTKCKKRLANQIYCDELGNWHSLCDQCFGGEE